MTCGVGNPQLDDIRPCGQEGVRRIHSRAEVAVSKCPIVVVPPGSPPTTAALKLTANGANPLPTDAEIDALNWMVTLTLAVSTAPTPSTARTVAMKGPLVVKMWVMLLKFPPRPPSPNIQVSWYGGVPPDTLAEKLTGLPSTAQIGATDNIPTDSGELTGPGNCESSRTPRNCHSPRLRVGYTPERRNECEGSLWVLEFPSPNTQENKIGGVPPRVSA